MIKSKQVNTWFETNTSVFGKLPKQWDKCDSLIKFGQLNSLTL